jgi:hypothetical protein
MEVIQMAEKIKPVEKVDDLTPVQKLAKIDAERAKLDAERKEALSVAKQEALQRANEALDQLNALGFNFVLSEEETPDPPKREPIDGPCGYCGFKTMPLHDKRRHRGSDLKRPFTAEELKDRGLVRVS